MAYSGYRIQLGSTTLHNSWITKGTFNISKSPRIAKTYEDIVGVSHDVPLNSTKTTITFSIREHNTSEHSTIASLFATRINREVTYWDDDTSDYLIGNFRIKNFTWNHLTAYSDSIEYGATQITLEEY